ncbi:MAG: phenylalanine--tRNA ligase subunit alpha [Bdellovibrionales bacterium]|nr:phenylalanine--tRNA ligase subunit alpha [Bdellovibrionales bacterium]
MIQQLEELGTQALKDVEELDSLQSLESLRVAVLGKKGSISEALKGLGSLSPEERPKVGAAANQWKQKLEAAIEARKRILEGAELDRRLKSERIDISLPSRRLSLGSLHPITLTTRRIVDVFRRMGFDPVTGPEVETDFLNFEAANVLKDHPARDMQDTFFLGPDVVLRTHTTPNQMRQMLSRKWPVRILAPGAVYRKDSDATHSPMFHQIEGLWVDRQVRMSDLKGVLDFFAKEIIGPEAKVRFRPSYFPFVEPGAEVDVWWKGRGWLEIMGAGMVHPRLFETAGYDPKEVSGFAFGMGVERIAMILHGIPDLRMMYQGDVRFLSQF